MNRRTPKDGEQSRQATPRAGFSFAEVVVGAAVLSMFMLATPLAIRMAGKAVPDGKSTASAAMDGSRALELFASDVAFATSVSSKSSTSLTFTVPDRNGDGVQETIQYSLSSPVNGASVSLLRQYNGVSTVFLGNVQEFTLAYDTRTAPAPTTTTGAETLLFSANSGNGLGLDGISASNWDGEYFQAVLPSNAVSWNLTRVVLNIQAGQVLDRASVQIWKAAGQVPDTTILDTSSQNASTNLSSVTPVSFPFSNVNNLSPSIGLFVVVTSADSSPACRVQKCSRSCNQGGFVSSNSSNTTWSTDNGHDLCTSVYGTVNTPGTTNTLYYLSDVRCTLRTNQNSGSRVTTSVRVLNQPQVTGP